MVFALVAPPSRPVVTTIGSLRCEPNGSCRYLFENSIASTSIFVLQVNKSQRWMPWRLEPMKDVGDCEKPWGVVTKL